MTSRRISIQLDGVFGNNNDNVRLPAFIRQLDVIHKALKHTERLQYGTDKSSVEYRIVDLKKSSPATIVIEALPIEKRSPVPEKTIKRFLTTLRLIQRRRQVPKDVDLPALESYRDVAELLKNREISHLKITNSHREVDLTDKYRVGIEEIIGPDEVVEGPIDGRLEWLNIHNKNRFNIYPEIGPEKVRCDFPVNLREEVIKAIDKDVRVYGSLRYKQRDKFPYAVNVTSIEVLPSESELPTLYDLQGIAPNATGDLTAESFIESLRHAE